MQEKYTPNRSHPQLVANCIRRIVENVKLCGGADMRLDNTLVWTGMKIQNRAGNQREIERKVTEVLEGGVTEEMI